MSPIKLIMSVETNVGRLWAQEEGSEDVLFGWLVGYGMLQKHVQDVLNICL